MNPGNCSDGTTYLSGVALSNVQNISRIGVSGNPIRNGSQTNVLGGGHTRYLNAINILYEWDADGKSGNNGCAGSTDCPSQMYMANGGVLLSTQGTLGQARGTYSDGGIVRTQLNYSTRSNLPPNCTVSADCPNYWQDITPDANQKWNSFVSIPYPENSAVTGAVNCDTSSIEMDCSTPYNIFTPSMKAIPYMKTAPNGDLYLIRNACASQTICYNGSGTCDFRTSKQVCPIGSEVTQLWMLPGCASSSSCPASASEWVLVAEYGSTGKTNMSGNTADCGNSPNKCNDNTHLSLLEIVGSYLYIGYDNATYGAMIWRTDLSSITSGNVPIESDFELVNIPGLDGTATNQKIFSHITVNDSGTDWLILTTRDGDSSVQIYRTSNGGN